MSVDGDSSVSDGEVEPGWLVVAGTLASSELVGSGSGAGSAHPMNSSSTIPSRQGMLIKAANDRETSRRRISMQGVAGFTAASPRPGAANEMS